MSRAIYVCLDLKSGRSKPGLVVFQALPRLVSGRIPASIAAARRGWRWRALRPLHAAAKDTKRVGWPQAA